VTPNKDIFCNSPWYELHVYWDGSLGFCCQESHKIYSDLELEKYNISNMTIKEWMNSEPMKRARMSMFGDQKNSFCQRCYIDENYSGSSRRHKSNQKSVIFYDKNFDKSYYQSPGFDKFESSRLNNGDFLDLPIDLHIDLGNYCNLACKMCHPMSSSTIAVQFVKWGKNDAKKYVGLDWTKDQEVWERTLKEIASIKKLNNVHFMGGETLITKRFEDFVDFMIGKGRTDLCFSFVTNGTTFNDNLMKKLTKFRRVGIEVSIETVTDHNSYQRQGTDTKLVLENIDRYLEYCNNSNITLTVRPAISLLTIGNYYTLLNYCLKKKLLVKSLLCYQPAYLNSTILPQSVKNLYLENYYKFMHDNDLLHEQIDQDFNQSDPNQIKKIVKQEVLLCIELLKTETPKIVENKYKELVENCKKWDEIYNYDALDLYPELRDIFIKYGY
jgi:uncharacterized Fe-S cluster-containing radical SAM superfamily protein